jgi:hypothetical protein
VVMFIGEVQAQAKLVANLRRELEAAEADLTRKIDVYLRSHRSTDLARTLLQETLKGTGGGRYFMCMRSVLFLVLALAGLGHADERADRLAIERMVASLNERVASRRPLRQFFTLDAEKEFAALQDLDRRLHPSAQLPWSEVTAPSIVVASLRFLTADVALADAASTRFGSTIGVSRVPLLLILRREAAVWKIASVRVLVLRE